MLQVRQPTDHADRFDREYPDTLPKRLEWLTAHLALDRGRVLRLMGLTARQAREQLSAPWKTLLKTRQDQAWRVEQLLCGFLALHEYDWEAAAARLRPPTAAPDGTGSGRAAELPHFEVLPPDSDRDTVLLTLIAEGGPSSTAALVAFLTPHGPNTSTR